MIEQVLCNCLVDIVVLSYVFRLVYIVMVHDFYAPNA
jgi:hypothetical protein